MSEQNPFSMDESVIALHEMFLSFVRAGFTRAEALELTKELLINELNKKKESRE